MLSPMNQRRLRMQGSVAEAVETGALVCGRDDAAGGLGSQMIRSGRRKREDTTSGSVRIPSGKLGVTGGVFIGSGTKEHPKEGGRSRRELTHVEHTICQAWQSNMTTHFATSDNAIHLNQLPYIQNMSFFFWHRHWHVYLPAYDAREARCTI
jgi:hypothetical protein